MIARIIQARITIDDVPSALLTLENTHTGTDDHPSYRVVLDSYREARQLIAEIKLYAREGKTRLELLAEAFRVIAAAEVAER